MDKKNRAGLIAILLLFAVLIVLGLNYQDLSGRGKNEALAEKPKEAITWNGIENKTENVICITVTTTPTVTPTVLPTETLTEQLVYPVKNKRKILSPS